MKIMNCLFIALIFLLACNSKTETSGQKVTFGIHEIAETNELPAAIMDTLKSMNVRIENKTEQYIIGYVTNEDISALKLDLSDEKLRIVRTINKVGDNYAIAAIKTIPSIDNSDVDKARVTGSDIEIYFTMEGAKKWADLTKVNIGKAVAFVIDNRICSMPVINAEIKSGMAILSGMNDETTARKIADAIGTE